MIIFQEPVSIQILQSEKVAGIDEVSSHLMGYIPPWVRFTRLLVGFLALRKQAMVKQTAMF